MSKPIFFNKVAIQFVEAVQKIRVLIAGRGFGKSTLIAWVLYEMMRVFVVHENGRILGAGKVFLASTTIEQIKNNLLAPIRDKWKEFGLVEGVHFVVCKRPPEWFAKPFSQPESYENVITFWNGFTVVLLSTAKPEGKRGGSYDAGIIDEASFVKGSVVRSVFFPMVRGNLFRFNTHWHHSKIVLSSMPRDPKGFWVYDFEKEAEANPSEVLYLESSALENRAILGEQWFADQKRALGDEYGVEIENKRITHLPNGFYHTFDRAKNVVFNPAWNAYRRDELLEVSFDFGGKFTCATIWQEHGFVEHCLRQFYIKRGKASALVASICNQYAGHAMKYVRIYGEPRGRDADPERPDLYTIIQQEFEARGWMVELMVKPGYKTKGHKERFEFMSLLLPNEDANLPRVQFDGIHCADVIKAIEGCDIKLDYTKEKKVETDPNFPQEHAPHFTDTVDYYLFEKHAWRRAEGAGHRASGVW